MAEPGAVFDGVWKKFRLGERHDSLRDLIPAAGRRLLGRRRTTDLQDQEFWAVRDVSFEAKPGQALGIVGPNGAGKSTTLKLLTRIMRPTRGRCEVRGRVGALIEVAAGFHPDLTGRENVFLQGAIMGMKQADIARKLDDIVEFSGLAQFIDTQVKRYSSGMQARLGFSIAAQLDPEVLLIDEVLAVGDMGFHKRCLDRMLQFKESGAVVVLVSHNLQAVSALCDTVLVLRSGGVLTLGPTAASLARYAAIFEEAPTDAPGPPRREVLVEIRDAGGRQVSEIDAGAEVSIRAQVRLPTTKAAVLAGMRVRRDDTGQVIASVTSDSLGCQPITVQWPSSFQVRWRFRANLARGRYFIDLLFIDARTSLNLALAMPAGQLIVRESQTTGIATAYLAATCSTEVVGAGVEVPV